LQLGVRNQHADHTVPFNVCPIRRRGLTTVGDTKPSDLEFLGCSRMLLGTVGTTGFVPFTQSPFSLRFVFAANFPTDLADNSRGARSTAEAQGNADAEFKAVLEATIKPGGQIK